MDREPAVLQWPNLFQLNSQVIIQTDTSLTGWEAVCNGVQTSGKWSEEERTLHINVLELLAIKLALLSFTMGEKVKAIHYQIEDKVALSYLLKMEGTKNEHVIRLSKEIWYYLLNHKMAITAEILPSVLNTVADRESRKKTDSSEWLLHPKVFQEFSWLLGSPTIDLFASRLCQKLEQMSSLCISPFQYDFKNAPKNKTGMCSSSDFDYTSLGTQNSSSSVSGNQCCCPRDKKFW